MNHRMLLLVAVAVLVAAPSLAFHDDGVAHCNGCHTMHNSQNGVPMNFAADGTPGGTAVGTGWDDLLLFANKSDVCLRCHGTAGRSYTVWSADPANPTDFNSAGDFSFLLEADLRESTRGSLIPGQAAGHNIMSGIKGTDWDTTLTTAPGGTVSNQLACSSCHDPHGTSSFRLLYQAGQSVDVGPTNAVYNFTIEAYGMSLSLDPRTAPEHNVYVANYSQWCSTCHGLFHQGSGRDIHPSGEDLDDQEDVYNAYMGTEDCLLNPPTAGNPCGSGDGTSSYLWLVPVEDVAFRPPPGGDPDFLYDDGATPTSKVACVTCHFAHASSAPDSGRWDFQVTFLDEDGTTWGTYALPNPYPGTPSAQRSLCNKCHSKDEFDTYGAQP